MKNSQRGFVVPLLISIIALLVLGGGTYIYLNQQPKIQQINQVENTDATTNDSSIDTQATSSDNNQAKQPSATKTIDYTGFYVFAEIGMQDPGASIVHTLDIFKENNVYAAYVNVDGYQTLTRIKADVLQKDSTLSVVFDSYLKDNMFTVYKKGDVLFTLNSTNPDKMKITWSAMKPSSGYAEYINNSFFEKSKITQQDVEQARKNIIGKWAGTKENSISFMSDGTFQEEGVDPKSSIASYGTWKIMQNLRGEGATDRTQASMPNGIYLKITHNNDLPMYYEVNIANGTKLKYTYLSGLADAAVLEFSRVK